MRKFKKTLNILLSLIMVIGAAAVMPFSSSAAVGGEVDIYSGFDRTFAADAQAIAPLSPTACIDAADVVPSSSKTMTLRFYMPEDWRGENNPYYDGENLSSCRAGIYWWEGSFNCSDFYGSGESWPGYSISETDKDDGNIFVVKVPEDVERVIFNNLVKSNDYSRRMTQDADLTGYLPDDNEFYPDGLNSVDNMIFVPDTTETHDYFSGTYAGSWFYYYGGGKYGAYSNRYEAEANGAVFSGGAFPEIKQKSIEDFTVSGINSKTYSGKEKTQNITVKDGDKILALNTDYTVTYKNNKNAGTATLTITGTGGYTGTITKTFRIKKAENPMKVSIKKSVKADSTKKTTIKNAVTVTKAQGKVSYKTDNKKVTVQNGMLTAAKGLKKGKTYKVKITVTAKGNKNFKSSKLVKTISIKVK